MPIPIGVLAVAGASVAADDLELIATFTGDDVSSTLDITNIPQTYKHLWLTGHLGGAGTVTTYDFVGLRLNSGTGVTITLETVHEASSALVGGSAQVTNGIITNWNRMASWTSDRQGMVDSLFMHYSDTSRARKGLLFLGTTPDDLNGKGFMAAGETNATAITSLQINMNSFAVGTFSTLYLYGMK